MSGMNIRQQWLAMGRIPAVRTGLFVLGWVLLLLTPVVGALPGPGGVIVFGAGATLILKYSEWAKRKYVEFKRKHPNKGRWADWSLRRQSAKRREELRKQEEALTATADD
jgi:Putative transmembrane protein (PGPGW)